MKLVCFFNVFQKPGYFCRPCTSVSHGVEPQQLSSSCLMSVWWSEPNARDRKPPNQHRLKQPSEPFVMTSLARGTKHLNTNVPITK